MNAVQTFERDELSATTDVVDERPAVGVLFASAFRECTCPGDCDRDHDNE